MFHLDKLVAILKATIAELTNRELLVKGALGRDNGRIGGERKVNSRIGHQIGLELVQIDVQGAIEPQRSLIEEMCTRTKVGKTN